MSDAERNRAAVALAIVQLFFGVHYFAAKLVLREIDPLAWAVLRATGAALVLHLIALAARRPYPAASGDWGRLAVYSLFGVIVNQLCFIEGLHRSTATATSLLLTGTPVITLMLAVLMGRERWSRRRGIALAACILGVLLVLQPTPEVFGSRAFRGNLLNLVNAASFSFFLVISKRTLERVDPIAATAVLLTFGSLGLWLIGGRAVVAIEWTAVGDTTWAVAAFIVVFPSAIGYMLNYWALKRVESSDVALFILLQPVLASLLGIVFLGERPDPGTFAGGALICAGVWFAMRRSGSAQGQPDP